MDGVQFALAVLLNLVSLFIFSVLGEVAYFPLESRNVNPFIHPQFQQGSRNVMPQGFMLHDHGMPQEHMAAQDRIQPILHTNPAHPPQVPESPMAGINFTVDDELLPREEDFMRAAKSGYDYPAHPAGAAYPPTPSYGYAPPAPSYSAAPSSAPPSYVSPVPAHPAPTSKFSLLKPDLTSLLKPVTTKVATKVDGLLGLLLSFLSGSAAGGFEMKGIKEVLINGILKPLLVAKGGIKSLISKLTIPVIALLLINVEVLITVWWLWEECPVPVKPTYTYAKPPYTPNYNSYR